MEQRVTSWETQGRSSSTQGTLPAGLDMEGLLPGLLFPDKFALPHDLAKQTHSWEKSVHRGFT